LLRYLRPALPGWGGRVFYLGAFLFLFFVILTAKQNSRWQKISQPHKKIADFSDFNKYTESLTWPNRKKYNLLTIEPRDN